MEDGRGTPTRRVTYLNSSVFVSGVLYWGTVYKWDTTCTKGDEMYLPEVLESVVKVLQLWKY